MTLADDERSASRRDTRCGEAVADRAAHLDKTLGSEKKVAANRLNAKKCTGPRTDRGKSQASLNALKHGLFARRRLIAGENARAYLELSESVFAEARPGTALERMLADQIVGDIWRLRRVEQAERAYLEHVRAANLARATRTLPQTERAQAQKEQETTSIGVPLEPMLRSVRSKLQAASRADKVMLDAMVAPERAFPYSTLEQIRRALVRDILRMGASLSELQAQRLMIEAPGEPEMSGKAPLSVPTKSGRDWCGKKEQPPVKSECAEIATQDEEKRAVRPTLPA